MGGGETVPGDGSGEGTGVFSRLGQRLKVHNVPLELASSISG